MTPLELILAGATAVLWVLGGLTAVLGVTVQHGKLSRAEAIAIFVLWVPVVLWALFGRMR